MKKIMVDEKEYTLEFGFESVECEEFVEKMFSIVSGASIMACVDDVDNPTQSELIKGSIKMVTDIPSVAILGFYAGLLENHNLSKLESKTLLKAYMKQEKLNFTSLYEMLKECMEEDGFFDLSGINAMLEQMYGKPNQKTTKSRKK